MQKRSLPKNKLGLEEERSTTEQIFNLRVLCEKYSQHQQDIFHVFIDYKKAFDHVWHDALLATMNRYNMGQKTDTDDPTALASKDEQSATFGLLDDTDGLDGNEDELINLVKRLDKTPTRYGMEISAEKTKLMRNSDEPIKAKIVVGGQKLETVQQFRYLGAVISQEGSKPEVHARIAQTISALTKLNPIWKDKNIAVKSKLTLLHA
ncbi:uncharacterized protein [Palaemon carinicauda]|uniref:uncharacterized protein n=1 Tax=Palaemon carinicauda TaxID=392227 RepID=UPI0035B62EC3